VDVLDFFNRTWSEDDAVGLKTFSVATTKLTLWVPALVDQQAPQSESRGTALAKSVLYLRPESSKTRSIVYPRCSA
jgi:hypothetical protein